MNRVFAPSCERNQGPIAEVLTHVLAHSRHVLEIGSGTGQHSVYLAPRLPHLVWQTSELSEHHASIHAWHAHAPAPNLRAPRLLHIGAAANETVWPQSGGAPFDAIFTSNTLHIMGWQCVQQLLDLVGQHLPAGGLFVAYGPFNMGGRYTAPSNRAFDAWLQARDPASGLRDVEQIEQVAHKHGLALQQNLAMPANNRMLVFQKAAFTH